jgi:mRNA interferase RelE/StbE
VTYSLVYTSRAIKDLKQVDQRTKKRIGSALLRYSEDPLKFAEKLTDPRLGTYRFRVGDYRVIFDLETTDIVVLRIGHRKDIYRRL